MKYKIYKLIHNDVVIYIGKTKQQYLSCRKRNGYPKIPKEIIKECLIELIEETDDITREEYWRLYYINIGCNLYNRRRGDGVYDRCEYIKQYRKTEKAIEYSQKNKEVIKEYTKNYYEKNKNNYKDYYEKNKEKIKEYQKEYRKKK